MHPHGGSELLLSAHSNFVMTGQLQTTVKFGGLCVNVMSYARGSRYETIDTSATLVCAPLSNSRPVSGYRHILIAMQTRAASKFATLFSE